MNAAQQPVEVTHIVTEDMRLPAGSTVVQCILHQDQDGGTQLDIRCVTIGVDQYDESNPAHRFLSVVANHLPEIMAEVSENAEMVTTGNIETRLAAAIAANQTEAPIKPIEVLHLPGGRTITEITVADEGDDEGSLV
jgi:hypothetical protein